MDLIRRICCGLQIAFHGQTHGGGTAKSVADFLAWLELKQVASNNLARHAAHRCRQYCKAKRYIFFLGCVTHARRYFETQIYGSATGHQHILFFPQL